MKETLNIRRMKAGEEIIVSRLCKRCIREINSKDMTKKQVEYLSNYFSVKNIRDSLKETEIYVALLGEKIVATGSLCEGRIKSFFVNPLHHKKGIGAKLVKYLEGILKKKGYSSVFLRSSKYAVGFYKKLGYKEIEKICPPEVGEVTVMIAFDPPPLPVKTYCKTTTPKLTFNFGKIFFKPSILTSAD